VGSGLSNRCTRRRLDRAFLGRAGDEVAVMLKVGFVWIAYRTLCTSDSERRSRGLSTKMIGINRKAGSCRILNLTTSAELLLILDLYLH